MAPVHGRKKDNKFNEIVVKRLHAFGKNTRKYAQKKVVRLDSRAHVPLVTRVSHSNYHATCQIKSIARYVGYFKYSQISRVVCGGGEGGGGYKHRHTLPVHYKKGLIPVSTRRGLPLSFSPFPSHFTFILSV